MLGIPNKSQAELFSTLIVRRYGVGSEEKALNYLDRLIDRIINKARGVITFNSIGMAVIALLSRQTVNPIWKWGLLLSILTLLGSSLMLLYSMFLGFFGKFEEYADFLLECHMTAKLVLVRGVYLNAAIGLSTVGFGVAALSLAWNLHPWSR